MVAKAGPPVDIEPVAADGSDRVLNRDRWRALREALDDGCSSLHSAIEAAAVQDSKRQIEGPSLQSLARGIEVLGKAVWILNQLRSGSGMPTEKELKPGSGLGHELSRLIERIALQASLLPNPDRYDHIFLANDPLLLAVVGLARDFANQGRYWHLSSLVSGEETSPIHLAWNLQIQNRTLAEPGAPLMVTGQNRVGAWLYVRERHVGVLQRLLRSLARQALDAQVALWGGPVAHRVILELLAGIPNSSLAACMALSDGCPCMHSDPGVSVFVEDRPPGPPGREANAD